MSYLYYLVGPPGSGKRTVGKALSKLTGAVLLDNHLTNDPVFMAAGINGNNQIPSQVWELAFDVRKSVRAAIIYAPPHLAHIVTNYLSAEQHEGDNVEQLRGLTQKRGVPFVPVWLSCPLPELERRMPLPERAERLKLRDPAKLRELLATVGTLPPPPDAIQIDTSQVSPSDAALLIASHAGALF